MLPQHQFNQRPRRTECRNLEIPFRQDADIWPLELDIFGECDGDTAGCGEVTLELGEYPVERLKAAGEQAMRVAILRRAAA